MEADMLQPRGVVLDFGASVLAPQLETIASVQACHRRLCSVATKGSDGNKYVSAAAAASALEVPAEQCQLLLYTLAAVGGKAGATAAAATGGPPELDGAAVCDLSLFLMAQLYNRETQKPETQDHWPEPHSSTRAAPGSPISANNSRLLIKHQLQQQQQRQQSYARGYADFLQKHHKMLLELIMDDSSAAEAWQQQRTAAIQQQKSAPLHQPPQQQPQQPASGGDSEMVPVDDPATAGSTSKAPDESMQSSPTRQTSDDGASSQFQQLLDASQPAAARGSGGGSLGSLARCTFVPPVAISASEFDRLGFLLEIIKADKAAVAVVDLAAWDATENASMLIDSGNIAAVRENKGAGTAASRHNIGSGKLSTYVPGYAHSAMMMMEDLLAWMTGSWAQELPQQQQQQQQKVTAASPVATAGIEQGTPGHAAGSPAALASDPAAAVAAAAAASARDTEAAAAPVLSAESRPPLVADAAWLGKASPAQCDSLPASTGALSSPPPSVLTSAVGGSPRLTVGNGLLPAPGAISPTSAGTAAAASAVPGVAGAGLLLSNVRINPINTSSSSSGRGMVAVAAGTVDAQGVCGMYRGTVVCGPSDITMDEVTIANCIECHIYLLAPVKLARITHCTDCTVCIGAVGLLLRVDCCERLQLTAAAGQVMVVSCHSCCLHLGTPRQPALLGDCRFVKLAPYNTRYETLLEHMAAAGIQPSQPSLWDQPLVLSCGSTTSNSNCIGGSNSNVSSGSGGGSGSSVGAKNAGGAGQQLQRQRPGASTPSSPLTHGSSGSERWLGAVPKPVLLMQPEELMPLVVPFRGTSGPLAGGAAHSASTQWLPGIHKQQAGPLPPVPFPLPDAFDAALQHQYAVITDLRGKIRGSGLDDGRRNQLQAVIQSYFREWLHSSGAIRQVYDLSKLEGDEYGPAAASPPASIRDHSQI